MIINPLNLNLNINPCSCCDNTELNTNYRIINDYIPPVIEIHITCPKCGQEVSKNLSQDRPIQEMFDNILGLIERWNNFNQLKEIKETK